MSGATRENPKIQCADSVMCCGHDPATFITSLAFQPGGHLLASVSNTGKLAVFDSGGFRRGGVVGPYATSHFDDAAVGEAHLMWLPESRLLVAVPGGPLLCYAAGAPEEINPIALEGEFATKESPINQACVDYKCSPLTPPTLGSSELPSSEVMPSPGGAGAVVVGEPSSHSRSNPAEPAVTPQPMESLRTKPQPSPIRTRPREIAVQVPTPQVPTAPPPHLPPIAVPSTSTTSMYSHRGRPIASQAMEMDNNNAYYRVRDAAGGGNINNYNYYNNSNSGGRQRRGHRRGSGNGSGGTGSQGSGSPTRSSAPGGMSPSLFEHIQQIRDAPAMERFDKHEELTGWGLGVAGGGTPLAWMGGAGGGGGQAAAAQGTPMYPSYAVPMQYHPAMMVPPPAVQISMQMGMMAAAPPGVGIGGVGGVVPGGMAPAGYASPRSPVVAMGVGQTSGIPPGAVMVPPGMMASQAAAAWAAVAGQGYQGQGYQSQGYQGQGDAPRQTHAQQAQQWAGLAPGYMNYQHAGAALALPPMSVQPPQMYSNLTVAGGVFGAGIGGVSRMPNMSGSGAPPVEHSRQSSGGFTSSSLGIAAAVAAAAQNNADAEDPIHRGNPSNSTDREDSEANNKGGSNGQGQGQQQPRRRSRGNNNNNYNNGGEGSAAGSGNNNNNDVDGGSSSGATTGSVSGGITGTTAMYGTTHESESSPASPSPHADSNYKNQDDLKISSRSSDARESLSSSLDAKDLRLDLGNQDRSGSISTPNQHPSTPSHPIATSGPAVDPSSTIYVGNLQPTVDEYALFWAASHFGPVAHVQIIRDKPSQASRGYGFVTFAHPAYATVAMQQLNGQVMYGPFGGHRIKAAPTNKRPTPPPSQTPSPGHMTPARVHATVGASIDA